MQSTSDNSLPEQPAKPGKTERKTPKQSRSRDKYTQEQIRQAIASAIRRGVTQEYPLLLLGNRDDGLFSSNSGVNKKAIAIVLEIKPPLLEFVGGDNGKDEDRRVRISRDGIQFLVAATPPNERLALWKTASRSYRQGIEIALDDQSRIEIDQVRCEILHFADKESALRKLALDLINAQFEKLAQDRDRAKIAIMELENLKSDLAIAKATSLQPAEPSRSRPLPESTLDFQRDLSEELVYAWQDTKNAEARQQIERVLLNIGMERIGIEGAIAGFDGSLHVTMEAVLPDEDVEIILPGWRLNSSRGRYLIARARVQKPNSVKAGP